VLTATNVSNQVLSGFNCVEVHGTYFLADDMRMDCSQMPLERAMALLGILLFPVGIPLLFLVRRPLSSPRAGPPCLAAPTLESDSPPRVCSTCCGATGCTTWRHTRRRG
jgi:hypothetical protein